MGNPTHPLHPIPPLRFGVILGYMCTFGGMGGNDARVAQNTSHKHFCNLAVAQVAHSWFADADGDTVGPVRDKGSKIILGSI